MIGSMIDFKILFEKYVEGLNNLNPQGKKWLLKEFLKKIASCRGTPSVVYDTTTVATYVNNGTWLVFETCDRDFDYLSYLADTYGFRYNKTTGKLQFMFADRVLVDTIDTDEKYMARYKDAVYSITINPLLADAIWRGDIVMTDQLIYSIANYDDISTRDRTQCNQLMLDIASKINQNS